MESKPKYTTNNDVDKVIKEFSEVVSPFVKDMKKEVSNEKYRT